MFKKLKIKANWFILSYDALIDTFDVFCKLFLFMAFLFFIGYFYDLSINPVIELSSYNVSIEMISLALGFSFACFLLHSVFNRFRVVFVEKICCIFPVDMMIGKKRNK